MTPTIVYIYPANDGEKHTDLAIRFIETYNAFPPDTEHNTVIVLNGAKGCSEFRCMFSCVQNVTFLERDDSGWDIGGYQDASRLFPADMMVFFGGSAHFRRRGWLVRMKQAFEKHGEGLYGATVNRGDPGVKVEPHVRTTGFWLSSALMNRYPSRVTRADQRYPFEHGKNCLTGWVNRQGLRAWLVTWTGEFLWRQWDDPFDALYRGKQPALLVGDRLTEQIQHAKL